MAIYCGKCGTKLDQSASFCPNCSTPVLKESQQPQQQPSYGAPAQYQQQNYQQPVYQQPYMQAAPSNRAVKKKSTGLTVLIIILVIVLAAEGVVAGIWLPGFFTGGKDTTVSIKSESAVLSAENPAATLCGVTIKADSFNLKDGDLNAVVADNGTGVGDDGGSYHEYDMKYTISSTTAKTSTRSRTSWEHG